MLKQRVLTAVALLALLAAVLGSQSMIAFRLTLAVFFAAACWESCRLLKIRWAIPLSALGGLVLLLMLASPERDWTSLALLCVLIWALRFAPALKFGLPDAEGVRGLLFATVFFIALLVVLSRWQNCCSAHRCFWSLRWPSSGSRILVRISQGALSASASWHRRSLPARAGKVYWAAGSRCWYSGRRRLSVHGWNPALPSCCNSALAGRCGLF